MKTTVDSSISQINGSVPSGMSVALMDAEGDYGAVVVSNANNHIDAAQFDDDSLVAAGWHAVATKRGAGSDESGAAKQAKSADRVCLNAAPARNFALRLQSAIDLLVVNGSKPAI